MEAIDAKQRIEAALRRVIMDTDGRFDECLVDKLFESIKEHRKYNVGSRWIPLEFEHYKDINGSVNFARLLKYHGSVSSIGPTRSDLLDFTVLKAFVNYLPQIVLRGRPQEITPALSHLLNIVNIEADKKLEYGIINLIRETHYDASSGMRDIFHLLSYLLETSRVYHIQNLAKTIFQRLILGFSLRIRPEHRPSQIEDSIKETTIALLCKKDSRLMHLAMIELFESASKRLCCPELTIIGLLHSIVKVRYEQLHKQSNLSTPNFNLLVKCVSYTETHPDIEIVEQMMARDNLEAIIMYATSGNWKPFTRQKRWLRVFILYPILARCQGDHAGVLAETLMVSSQEEKFIKRNIKDRHVLQCLTYLIKALYDQQIDSEWTIRVMKIALEYLKCNINSPKDLKNLSLCCQIIVSDKIYSLKKTPLKWLKESEDAIINVLNQIDYNSFPNKPIFNQVIQALSRTHDMLTMMEVNKGNLDQLIEMAFKISDPDVLNELTHIFEDDEKNRFPTEDTASTKYPELIFKHLLPIARDSNHHKLIAYTASLLIYVNAISKVKTMQDDLPRTIGDLLIENSHIEDIACAITTALVTTGMRPLQKVFGQTEECDHIYKGICKVLMSNSSAECYYRRSASYACRIIDDIVEAISHSHDLFKWERLARIGVLDLLHDIHSRSAYKDDRCMRTITNQCLDLSKNLHLTRTEFEELIGPHTTGAGELARFFTSGEFTESPMHSSGELGEGAHRSDCCNGCGPKSRNKLGLNSYLDDILNDDLVAQMAECY